MTIDPTPNGIETLRPLFRRVLVLGAVLAVGLAVVGGVVGYLVAGTPGLLGGLIGAVMSVVFLGLTAASLLVAIRVSRGQMISGAFFGIVMGTFLVKFVLFIVVLVALRDRDWVSTPVLAVAIIAGVIGSLVIDMVVVARSRVPIDVRLPGDDGHAGGGRAGDGRLGDGRTGGGRAGDERLGDERPGGDSAAHGDPRS